MIKIIGIIYLTVLTLDDACGRKYQTLVQSEFPMDAIEQPGVSGSLYKIPLIPRTEDVTPPSSSYGLKVIKVNRRPVSSESKTSNAQVSSHKRIQEKSSQKPKKIHYSYTIPEDHHTVTDSAKVQSSGAGDKNKHIAGEEDYFLPKQERKELFYPGPQEKIHEKSQITESSNTVSSSNHQLNKAVPVSNPEISSETSTSQSSHIELFKIHGAAEDELRERLYSFPKVNNYDLVNADHPVYLETDIVGYPYYNPVMGLYDLSPKIFNIYYDTRYMQNAPTSHSFIYSHPLMGPIFGPHVPQHFQGQPTLFHQAPGSHVLNDLTLKGFADFDETNKQFLPKKDAAIGFHKAKDVYSQIPEERYELPVQHATGQSMFKEPVERSELTDEEIEKYFLPKKVVATAFDKTANSLIPEERYGLPDVLVHNSFRAACGINCYPFATKYEFGVPVLEVSKLPSSYDVPLY